MKKFLNALVKFSGTWTGTIIIVLFLIFFVLQSFVIPSGSMKRTLLVGDFLFAKKFSYGVPIPHLPWLEIPLLPDFNGNGHLISAEGPKRGDIVIFRPPHNPKTHFVKRCVGVGEDELIYIDKHLFLRPHEGDAYIKQNYSPKKIVVINGNLWVRDPYTQTYPGIRYVPESGMPIFEILLSRVDEIDMKPIFIQGLNSPEYKYGDVAVNALYKKIPKDNYYMIGDNRDNSNDSRFWGAVPYANIVGKPWVIYFSMEFQSYDTLLNGDGSRDHSTLKKVCGDIDITSNECEKLWNKERFKIRWGRIGSIQSLELKEPTQ